MFGSCPACFVFRASGHRVLGFRLRGLGFFFQVVAVGLPVEGVSVYWKFNNMKFRKARGKHAVQH